MDDSAYFEIFEDDTKLVIPKKFVKEQPRTYIADEFFVSGTRHEAVVPFNTSYTPIPHEPRCTAKKYKFELDTFQKLAISSIESEQSVLVSAHTSCGKTVVAEYAIAQSIRNNQRVVYTSPIKALSNQKYRELQEEFKDVGLMTGDVTINPEASCLVMTTEILRNMLYRGSEVIREVHWIIFDEIHYMRDKERGVVWEETIILLPSHVRMVFLSATIPNALEFAEWISYIQSQIVHVVYTEKRVIPLLHYFQTDGMYLIKDKGFHVAEFNKAMDNVPSRKEMDKLLLEAIEKANMPAVIFSFSRKECENYAMKVKKDFLNEEEKEMVKTIFENAISSLREEDRTIPLIEKMLPLLQRGIGIHHSGLLPIIREIVEILFQESLLKILFATETFSIGLNMPAKTVIFTSLRKFDGENRRLLTSGEFIQMSGRAGRRGLDEIGVVISILTEELTVSQVKTMFSSNSDKLYSAFRLTYNMILNLLRVEGFDPEYVLSRSFFHFQAYKNALIQESKITEIEPVESNEMAEKLIERDNLIKIRSKELVHTHRALIGMKGRVVDLYKDGLPIRNAIVHKIEGETIAVYVLTNKDIEQRKFSLDTVTAVYDIRCKTDVKVFSRRFKNIEFRSEWDESIARLEEEIRRMDPGIDFGSCLFCNSPSRKCLIECEINQKHSNDIDDTADSGNDSRKMISTPDKMDNSTNTLDSYMRKRRHGDPNPNTHQALKYLKYLTDQEILQEKLKELDKLKEIYHMDECKRMIQVLKRLEYIDDTSVLIKGKMASEISAGDELVITEMIFTSNFTELSLIDMVALLSCFVCEENTDDTILTEENDRVYSLIVSSTERVVRIMNESGMQIEDYIKKFSYGMMDVVKMWMSGKTFIEICQSTSIFEGSIIRGFKRLEELLRQLTSAAAVIGNSKLVDLFSQGIFQIKRDIVFANSLYL